MVDGVSVTLHGGMKNGRTLVVWPSLKNPVKHNFILIQEMMFEVMNAYEKGERDTAYHLIDAITNQMARWQMVVDADRQLQYNYKKLLAKERFISNSVLGRNSDFCWRGEPIEEPKPANCFEIEINDQEEVTND